MYKHIFFDLDNTLTRSRSKVTPSMRKLLKKLSQKHDVIVVSGAEAKQIDNQLGSSLSKSYFTMGQNGNTCINKNGKQLWERKMNWMQKLEVFSYADKVISKKLVPYKNIADLVQDRGCQVSYSLIGHNEDVGRKEKCDPEQKLRLKILKKFPFKSRSIEVKIGGTTCLDFFIKGYNKGKNVAELCKEMGWKKSECLYIGDALFKNGNDETVIGVIPTRKVADPKGSESVIKELLHIKS